MGSVPKGWAERVGKPAPKPKAKKKAKAKK